MKSATPFLLFVGEQHGKAAEAVRFYTSLFDDSELLSIDYFGPGEMEPEGSVKNARFSLNGTEIMAMESALAHAFTFTPAISLFVECESEEEISAAYGALADGGQALMPLSNYGFSKRFGWIQDRYGVSWQLNLQ